MLRNRSSVSQGVRPKSGRADSVGARPNLDAGAPVNKRNKVMDIQSRGFKHQGGGELDGSIRTPDKALGLNANLILHVDCRGQGASLEAKSKRRCPGATLLDGRIRG